MPFNKNLANKLTNPWQLRLWMLTKLPMGLVSGMYVESLDENSCRVVLKDRRWIRNPFRSVFWAVMGMAAELSTGALVYAYASGSDVRFILVGMEAEFFKKTKGKSYYFCDTGFDVLRSIELLVHPNDTSFVMLPVTAKDQAGQVLATFTFHWQLRKPII
jgi:hypothetical protein